MHRHAGDWRHGEGIFPFALLKEWQWERRGFFIKGVRAGKFWGCEGFCPNFPKLARKAFCATFAYTSSPTTLGAILTRIFRAFSQIFSKPNFLGMRLQPMHPQLQHHCFS